MADPSPAADSPPSRTTGGEHFRWEPPSAEELQAAMPGYTIEKILGRGGMGAVYRGVQTNLDRLVAIKILPPGVEREDPSFAERFKSEARLMAKLMHPAIVAVFDFGTTTAGQLYFAMEYVDGSDVSQMIKEQGRLPPDHALAITAHVCDALTAAHKLGIVHRDIKPANVLINREGQVKIADFGLAKIDDPSQHGMTKTGYAMGTPDFVSPEALMLGTAIDGRADIYAVGVMLYQMLTGNIPRGAFKSAAVLRPNLDPRYDPIIMKAMQHDREERYQSAAELRQALDVILTVPFVQQDAPAAAVVPASQVAQMSAPRSAAQKPVAKGPPERRAGVATARPPGGDAAADGRAKATPVPPQQPAKANATLYTIVGVAAVLAIGAFVMFSGGKQPVDKSKAIKPTAENTGVNSGTMNSKSPDASTIKEEWKDLLPLIDPLQDKVVGNWRKDGSRLICDMWGTRLTNLKTIVQAEYAAGAARLEIPYQPPAEYDFRIIFTRRGRSNVDQILSHHGKAFTWGLGTFDNRWNGFSLINGKTQSENPTKRAFVLEDGVYYNSVVQVRNDGVKAVVNGQPAGEWKTNYNDLSQEPFWKLRNEALLGVGAWACETIFSRIEVREVSGKGTITRGSKPVVAVNPNPAPAAPAATFTNTLGMQSAPGPLSFGGHRYQFVASVLSWSEARAKAESLGGHLATVKNQQTHEWILANIAASQLKRLYDAFWIGGRKASAASAWSWSDGSEIKEFWWTPYQPDVGTTAEQGGYPAMLAYHKEAAMIGFDDKSDAAAPHRHWRNNIVGFLVEWDTEGGVATAPSPASSSAPPQSPASAITIPELAELHEQFVKLTAERVTAVFDADVAKLNAGYVGGLDRKIAEEKAAGHLDGVIALEAEKQLIQGAGTSSPRSASGGQDAAAPCPIPADDAKTTAALKGLRAIYRDTYAKLEAARTANRKALVDPLSLRLQQLESDLTKKDRIADAKVVREYREKLGTAPAVAKSVEAASSAEGFVALLDGEHLGAWQQIGTGGFNVKEGVATSWAEPKRGGCWWYAGKQYGDFVLKLEFKIETPGGNSGVYVRSPNPGNDMGVFDKQCYQIDVSEEGNPLEKTGAIAMLKAPTSVPQKARDWNELEIEAVGQHYLVKVNGTLVNDHTGNKQTSGYLGLQSYNVGGVQFRNLRIKELSPSTGSATSARPPPALSLALKDGFTNTLGMKFLPVKDTAVLFCVHETRYKDYAVYAAEGADVGNNWKDQTLDGFAITERNEDHPVVSVSWDDAQKFCAWLSKKEGKTYRLPTDEEWSYAVGIGRDEKRRKGMTPDTVIQFSNEFPWGSNYPLKTKDRAGNYSDQSRKAKAPKNEAIYIENYDDGYPTTAPVMSYKPNKLGIYDLGGNVFEWCEDWFDASQKVRVLRGGAWSYYDFLQSSGRYRTTPGYRLNYCGFRVVVEVK